MRDGARAALGVEVEHQQQALRPNPDGQRLAAGFRSISDGKQQVVVIGVAFAVTTFFNRFKMPTSTIQILVFSVVGVTVATHGTVRWGEIGRLAVVWALAPLAA